MLHWIESRWLNHLKGGLYGSPFERHLGVCAISETTVKKQCIPAWADLFDTPWTLVIQRVTT